MEEWKGIANPKHRRQVYNKVMSLTEEPRPPKSALILGFEYEGQPVRRLRSGRYRIFYLIRDHGQGEFSVQVTAIRPRNEKTYRRRR